MRLLLAFLALLLASCASVSLPEGQVKTTQGIAHGITADGISSYLGIEYARARRWALAEDGPDWNGVKTFDAFGPACPQDGQEVMVEDCLFLNVFTPESATRQARLPVVVWIHGGGFRAGQGGTGPKLFAREGVIVVTFNYRLGLLGFRDWPGWSETDPRNFGQADIVKALQWVNANIAGFGGDNGNITIAGHSAGGMAVQLMMVDPRARGLFHRAISDAGYGTWPFPKAANPTPEERARMRYDHLEVNATLAELVRQTPYYHLPYLGGSDLPQQPIDEFRAGKQAPVAYIAGANSLDGKGTINGAGFTTDSFLGRYEDDPAVREAYAQDFAVSRDQAAERLFGDMRYVFAAWQSSRAMTTVGKPGYLFYFTEPTKGLAGAAHGGHYGPLFGPDSFAMKSYFLNFIKTGTPNSDALPKWSPYDEHSQIWMVFDPQPEPVAGKMSVKMHVLEGLRFPGSEKHAE